MQLKIGTLGKSSFILGLGVLVAIVLLPYTKNGFWADDALNSQTWGMVNRFNTSVGEFSYRVCRAWLVDYGRILLPWPAIYGFFYVFRDELAARLADMALFISHVSITIYLLRRVGISWRTVVIFLLALLSLLQIRDYGDPLAAYAGFSQVVGILLMLSLVLLHKWYVSKDPVWLAASSMLSAISMTCYEVNAVYLPIAMVVVLTCRHRSRARDAFIVATPFIAFMVLSIYVKHIALTPYDGSTFGHMKDVPITFFKQLLATAPGSFYAFIGHLTFPFADVLNAAISSWLAWGVLILWSGSALVVVRFERSNQPGLRVAIFAAAMLLLVPPALISASVKYQSLLTWGTGHVPVYYQCFGLAFIIAAVIDRLTDATRWQRAIFVVPVLGACVALNWELNMLHSTSLDVAFREPRDSLVTALNKGLFENIREGDVVQIDGQPMFINGNLIYQTIQKNVSIPGEPATAAWFVSPPRPDAKTYRLFRDVTSANQWKVAEQ